MECDYNADNIIEQLSSLLHSNDVYRSVQYFNESNKTTFNNIDVTLNVLKGIDIMKSEYREEMKSKLIKLIETL